MKLLKQAIVKNLEVWDEGRLNKKFYPRTIYGAITMASIILGQKIINAEYKNELYKQYCRARRNKQRDKANNYIGLLQVEVLKDKIFVNKFLELTKTTNIEDDESHSNFYSKDAIGFLAFEDSED
jgi:hypothetical protein